MARLDVRKLKGSMSRKVLVIELQSNYMREIPTVVVAPLIGTKQRKPYDVINPILEIGGEQMSIRLEEMVGIPSALLGDIVGSAAEAEDRISVALSRLLFYV